MTAAKLRARLFEHPRLPVTSGSADNRDVYIVGELSNFVESAVGGMSFLPEIDAVALVI
jgi:hypothetical protein